MRWIRTFEREQRVKEWDVWLDKQEESRDEIIMAPMHKIGISFSSAALK